MRQSRSPRSLEIVLLCVSLAMASCGPSAAPVEEPVPAPVATGDEPVVAEAVEPAPPPPSPWEGLDDDALITARVSS